ncbi:sigma factor-like helix-turn-helix DNA-binding protein [Mesoflavibacter zeaxanthinifaciens]|uniref:sigma factor-like helix-turn-helix DNA-binding protein n=1 Tax=Mesoflavibacter zeaxanthinifaciens TaxID=393060 RepID=UPI00042567AE|nr:sigma factor-like helix-turn-helix DNA-binding protein [Mesoflavibacter zeaxanthinifaciens]
MTIKDYEISKDVFNRYKKAFEELLSERYFEMLRLQLEEGKNFSEVAEHFDISATRVKQILARSFQILEKAGYVGKRTVIE